MDFGFLASANSITSKYFEQTAAGRSSVVNNIDDETKKQFVKEIENAYDTIKATKALDENSGEGSLKQQSDPLREHVMRLGYSIDNRVIDMLNIQFPDDMDKTTFASA
ncbi:MAG: hypothetical protein K6E91_09215 [Butyrivibrio sp.]|nr:hypothetical protein [Butyrivibrio sp.]